MTRMGNLALQRAAFLKAKKLRDQWARWRDEESRRIEARLEEARRLRGEARGARPARRVLPRERRARSLRRPGAGSGARAARRPAGQPARRPRPTATPALETLVAAIEGRVLVHVHCYRADDMLAMLALADEMGFRVRSFHHALEAYKIRDVLAARQIAVSTWADWWGFKMEAYDGIPENAALVQRGGGRAIIHSDSDEGIQRLNQEASKALASGRRAGHRRHRGRRAPLGDHEPRVGARHRPPRGLARARQGRRRGALEPGPVLASTPSPRRCGSTAPSSSSAASPTGATSSSARTSSRPPAPCPCPEVRRERARACSPSPLALGVVVLCARDAAAQQAPKRRTPAAPAPRCAAVAEAPPLVYTGATIHTGTGEVIADAHRGRRRRARSSQVGKGIAAPAGAQTVERRRAW